jgi:hypothetical protein
MVVKHLKDLKKKRQAMIAAMEPVLFRSFKLGFMDCTRATMDFLSEIDAPEEKKKMILEHVNKANVKLLENKHSLPPIFTQHHERIFANVNPPDHFLPLSFFTSNHSSSTDSDIEWPSFYNERHSLNSNAIFSADIKPSLLDMKPIHELTFLKIAEPTTRMSAFNIVKNKSSISCMDSPSTSTASLTIDDETPQRLISHQIDISDDDDDEEDNDINERRGDGVRKLIIDDPNNNQMTWRPWL